MYDECHADSHVRQQQGCNLPLDYRVQRAASDSPAVVEVHAKNPYNTITGDTLVMIWYPG